MYYECSKKMFTIRQISDKADDTKNNSLHKVSTFCLMKFHKLIFLDERKIKFP